MLLLEDGRLVSWGDDGAIRFWNVKPINWQRQAITCLANDYLLITAIGVILYLLAIVGVWLDPAGARHIQLGGPVRNLWILPIAMCITAYFCLVQFFLHRIVYRIKDARISVLREKQQVAFDSWEETREKCHADDVAFLDKLIENVSKEESWPFDLPKAATILLPVFLPATKEIVGLFSVMFKG